jgi:uncharacterized membrane protein/protein-disulfide isomerase
MSSRSRLLILGLAIIGLAFATYSAWVHYQLLTNAGYESPCDISSSFNCSTVYKSQYGSVAGVPVALGGVFWFGLVALIALFSKPKVGTAPAGPGGAYVFALSTIGLAVILYLGYASFFVLKTGCVLCIGTYVSVIGIFIVSGASGSVNVWQLPARAFGDLSDALREPVVMALTLVLLAGTAYAVSMFPREGTVPMSTVASTPQGNADFATAWAQQPRVELGIPADGAKVLVVKFNDYQCGACGSTHAWYKPVLEKFEQSHPGAVKYVLKDWPWQSKCNFNLAPGAPPNHVGACEAAAAVRMARDKGRAKEVEMEEWLFANQAILNPETVKASAEKILGISDFSAQYALKLPDIKKDVSDGTALGINSTPTLFINGVRIDRQLMPAAYFELAIQLELNKAAGK